MSLAEEIKKILIENPSILVDVLTARPEILYQALLKVMPWQNLATKQDLEEIRKEMVTKGDLEEVRKEMATKKELEELKRIMATKDDLEEIRKEMVTKKELEEVKKIMATKQDLEEVRKEMATKKELEEVRKEMATKKELEEIRKEMATKQEMEEIRRIMATKDDLENVRKEMTTKQELEEVKKIMATKDDIKKLEAMINGLGTRWGLVTEDVFRQGIAELLSKIGWTVNREILYDKSGFVYGYPSEIEIDVVIKDGQVILVEITGTLKRSDLIPFSRKKEFFEREKNLKVSEMVVITAFIDDKNEERVIAIANSLGLKVIKPTQIQTPL